jgi:hypothetical protein
MSAVTLEADRTRLRVTELIVEDREIVGYFGQIPDDALEIEFTRAVKLGVVCLERASASQDLDFVRKEVEGLLADVAAKSREIPPLIAQALASKIGTADGQVLSSIPGVVGALERAVNAKIAEVRAFLDAEVDPSKATSTLARALDKIKTLLDPNSRESIQSKLESAVASVSSEGGALAASVKKVVDAAVRPLVEGLDQLQNAVVKKKGEEEKAGQTTLKGGVFEEEVYEEARRWGNGAGCEVERVGPDSKPGDVLVVTRNDGLMEEPTKIIIEARDTSDQEGKTPVNRDMLAAMRERNADYGIYVKRSSDQFAKELGEWYQGSNDKGPWVSCSFEHLRTTLRFALVMRRIEVIRKATHEVDSVQISTQIGRIRNSFQRIANIKTKATKVEEAVGIIRTEADGLKDEIDDALHALETALGRAQSAVPRSRE